MVCELKTHWECAYKLSVLAVVSRAIRHHHVFNSSCYRQRIIIVWAHRGTISFYHYMTPLLHTDSTQNNKQLLSIAVVTTTNNGTFQCDSQSFESAHCHWDSVSNFWMKTYLLTSLKVFLLTVKTAATSRSDFFARSPQKEIHDSN